MVLNFPRYRLTPPESQHTIQDFSREKVYEAMGPLSVNLVDLTVKRLQMAPIKINFSETCGYGLKHNNTLTPSREIKGDSSKVSVLFEALNLVNVISVGERKSSAEQVLGKSRRASCPA